MTTSTVSQIHLYSAGRAATSSSKNVQTDAFSQIFASQTDENNTVQMAKADEMQEKEINFKKNDVKEPERVRSEKEPKRVSDSEPQAVDKEDSDKVLSEEDLEEATHELLLTIQEVMNVSLQDIQNALQELGINAEELLNMKNISSLVIALTEGADELSLMTSEEVFAQVQEITTKAEGLLAQLSEMTGMSFEEIQAAITEVAEAEIVVEEPEIFQSANPAETVTTQERVMVLENMQTVSSERTGDDNRSDSDSLQGDQSQKQMTYAQTVVEQLEQAVAKTDTVTNSYTSTTESIMNQIQNSIRVIQTQDMTEMELQLHPASLGSLRIQIAAKEGAITAVLTTENETVRAALESQLITLKENFEQQGIKVEAVEVTVASHAFEQNLNGEDNHAGEEQTAEKKKSTRKITVSDLTMDELDEELSDEDRIVAEMMKENGNTVDYTV